MSRAPVVHYVPIPRNIIYKFLDPLNLSKKDVLWDLGCGDGRILIAAAKHYGTRAIGVEIRRGLARIAHRNIVKHSLTDRAEVIHGDFFRIRITSATAITLYLSTRVNEALKGKFCKELRDGTRIASLDFRIPGWEPNSIIKCNDGIRSHNIYLYVFKRSKYICGENAP